MRLLLHHVLGLDHGRRPRDRTRIEARPHRGPAQERLPPHDDVQELPGAAARRAPRGGRALRRRPPAAPPPPRRRAALLRHERLSHHPPTRRPHRRRHLPDLRVPPPALLTRRPRREPGAAAGRDTAAPRPPRRPVDGPWITRRRTANLVDGAPCPRAPERRSSPQPEGAVMNGPWCRRKAAGFHRKGSRALRQGGRPSAREASRSAGRTGAERRRTRSREREVFRKERHSCPQGWRVPRKGGAAIGSAVPSGAFVPCARGLAPSRL